MKCSHSVPFIPSIFLIKFVGFSVIYFHSHGISILSSISFIVILNSSKYIPNSMVYLHIFPQNPSLHCYSLIHFPNPIALLFVHIYHVLTIFLNKLIPVTQFTLFEIIRISLHSVLSSSHRINLSTFY